MEKKFFVWGACLCYAPVLFAQQPVEKTDTLDYRQDNASFIFSEDQLNEEDDASKVTALVSSATDPYMSEVGYLFSHTRFRYRGFDSQYNTNYMNGVRMNNVENGRFSYSSMTGGLNDAMRNREGASFMERNTFGYSDLGGASNINLRASQYAAGNKLGLALTNRNYVARLQYTYATGILENGWSFMAGLGYRWANRTVIDGMFYNSFSYILGAEKFINDHHHLSFVTWGAPTERGQQGAATEEAYWLANSHYYNPYWGYQNGKRRNSRVVTDFSPSAMLTWDYIKDDRTKLSTAVAGTYTNYGSTALQYNNAYNPRPDYYKNLPSSVFNVYNETFNNADYLMANAGVLEQYNALKDYWMESKTNRQVQWDRLYAMNEANNATGRNALYYQEKRHNDQLAFHLASTLNKTINPSNRYTLGVNADFAKGMHYKTMEDMLGANTYIDLDSYSIADYGYNSPVSQNDLNNPNRSIKEGDKFGYNYNIFVNKLRAWGMYGYTAGNFGLTLGGNIEGTQMYREGKMRNGRYPENSYGEGGRAKFLSGDGKLKLTYKLGSSYLTAGASYGTAAPTSYNSFQAPRIQNNFVNNLKNERHLTGDVDYNFVFGPVSGKVGGYYARIDNATQQSAFFNEGGGDCFTYLTMTDVKKEHYGVEAAISVKLTSNLKLNMLGTLSEAKYINNPLAQLTTENGLASSTSFANLWKNPITGAGMEQRVIYDGIHVSGTPLTAASIGLDYNVKGWYFSANLNYYDRTYVDASPYTRMGSIMDNVEEGRLVGYFTNAASGVDVNTGAITTGFDEAAKNGGNVYDAQTGELLKSYTLSQEKYKGGFMLDASIGHSFYLKHGRRLNVNLQVNNILNNTNLKTGGYEQSRSDKVGTYMFSKNSYYFYANAINAFLNASLRF